MVCEVMLIRSKKRELVDWIGVAGGSHNEEKKTIQVNTLSKWRVVESIPGIYKGQINQGKGKNKF